MFRNALPLLCRSLAAAALTGLAFSALAEAPIASATLLVDGRTHSVTIMREANVAVSFAPAEYQDLQISKAFYVICKLPYDPGPFTVSVRVDNRYNLIPADVVEYKTYDPSYIELDIDTLFLTNRTDSEFWKHTVFIDFFPAGSR